MTFEADQVDAFLELFNNSKELIRGFDGCSHLELLKDYNNPCIFSTYSIWRDEEALNSYRHSELFAKVWASTKSKFAAKPIAFSSKEFIKV